MECREEHPAGPLPAGAPPLFEGHQPQGAEGKAPHTPDKLSQLLAACPFRQGRPNSVIPGLKLRDTLRDPLAAYTIISAVDSNKLGIITPIVLEADLISCGHKGKTGEPEMPFGVFDRGQV